MNFEGHFGIQCLNIRVNSSRNVERRELEHFLSFDAAHCLKVILDGE